MEMFWMVGENSDGSVAVGSSRGTVCDVYVRSPYPSSEGTLMPSWAWTVQMNGVDVLDLPEDDKATAFAAWDWLVDRLQPPSYWQSAQAQ